MDLTAFGVSSTMNQAHRASAAPISSCHCCAPRRWWGLNHTGTSWASSNSLRRRALAWSRLAWERNTSRIGVAHVRLDAQRTNLLRHFAEVLGRLHLSMRQLQENPRHVLARLKLWADQHRVDPTGIFLRAKPEL